LLSGVSRILSLVVLVALTIAVTWLGWQAGASAGARRDPRDRPVASRRFRNDPG
jgi:fructose-specific phosphotransferase system IIC component